MSIAPRLIVKDSIKKWSKEHGKELKLRDIKKQLELYQKRFTNINTTLSYFYKMNDLIINTLLKCSCKFRYNDLIDLTEDKTHLFKLYTSKYDRIFNFHSSKESQDKFEVKMKHMKRNRENPKKSHGQI